MLTLGHRGGAGSPDPTAHLRRRRALISSALALVVVAALACTSTPASALTRPPTPPAGSPVGPATPDPAIAGASNLAAVQACSLVQVAGRSWLGGAGVDVHSNGPDLGTGYSCAGLSTTNPAVQNGYGWQCVELAARLYAVKGWGRVYADGGPAAGGYRYGAKYIPEGSPNLQFHPNSSGYRPVPGDLIIESFSSGWGHVSVVDRTVGSTVYAVEQNATLTGHHTYTLTGSTLSGQYGDSTRGFMHAPANKATNTGTSTVLSPGDFTGDGKSDLLGITGAGDLYLYRGNGLGGFAGARTRLGGGWGIFTRELSTGDFTGDGKSDLLGITPGGDLYLYRGNGLGGFTGGGTRIGRGWGIFGTVFSSGDFTGDGKTDILGVTPGGDLYLYRGNGLGGFTGGGTRISTGWGMFTRELSTGDFTGDAKTDILGITPGGNLQLYRGNGLGGLTGAGTKIGGGWGIFGTVFSGGDFTGDAKTDILGITPTGGLYLYRGNGLGGFTGAGTKIGTGWGIYL